MSKGDIFGLALILWFAALAVAELLSARGRSGGSDGRLLTNFGLGAITLTCASLLPAARILSSALAASWGFGLSPLLGSPWAVTLALLLLADSFAAYWTHRLMHRVPLLWRIHRVHHSDSAVDVSTSLRNHPLELLVTAPVSAMVIAVLGAPPTMVIVLQTITLAASMAQHADIDLPARADRFLSAVLVTPSFHRIHHSPERHLHDGNYGDLITVWDRLFGTSRLSPRRGPVGLNGQSARPDGLIDQIWSPVHAV